MFLADALSVSFFGSDTPASSAVLNIKSIRKLNNRFFFIAE
jgi:hypothetical protein